MSCALSSKPDGHCVALARREKVTGVLPYVLTHSHTPAANVWSETGGS